MTKYESARPNDDRSVPTERTHNHSSPKETAGITHTPPRPLSMQAIVPYQSEEKVKLCTTVR